MFGNGANHSLPVTKDLGPAPFSGLLDLLMRAAAFAY
jgi:hypothetical protein